MEIDSIWKDDLEYKLDNTSEHYNIKYICSDSSDSDSDSDENNEELYDSSIPEDLLNYFLSPEREKRLKHFQSLSLKNRKEYIKSAIANTRRNTKNHIVTPKRKRNQRFSSNMKKTKKRIFLKP